MYTNVILAMAKSRNWQIEKDDKICRREKEEHPCTKRVEGEKCMIKTTKAQ